MDSVAGGYIKDAMKLAEEASAPEILNDRVLRARKWGQVVTTCTAAGHVVSRTGPEGIACRAALTGARNGANSLVSREIKLPEATARKTRDWLELAHSTLSGTRERLRSAVDTESRLDEIGERVDRLERLMLMVGPSDIAGPPAT